MEKVINFGGVNIVIAHITSFYLEAGDTVCVTLSSGEELKETFEHTEAEVAILSFTNMFTDTPHI